MIIICLIPYTYIFTGVSIHFTILLVKLRDKSKFIKLFISSFGLTICTIGVVLYLVYLSKLALYDIPSDNLILAAKIVSSIVFGFEIIVFIARSIYIYVKIINITVQSDKNKRRKKEYYTSLFWIIIVSIGYLMALSKYFNYSHFFFIVIYKKVVLLLLYPNQVLQQQ